MPQKKNRMRGGAHPAIIGIGCLIIIVIIVLGVRSNGLSGLEAFPHAGYLEKPADFLGNTYVLRGQVDSQIKWQKEVGRIVAVELDAARIRLPVFVPNDVGGNIQPGQRFDMQVKIHQGGLIHVEALHKY